jgi:hypothetical protein
VPVHTAEPCATFGTLVGSNDSGNALFEGSRRYIPSNLDALILKDTYNYEIVMPETFGTFHSVLNETTGNLLVRGGDDNDTSNDVMSVTRSGDVVSSVDVGNDIPGTGPDDQLTSRYPAGQVQSITLNGNDGADAITMGADLGVPFTVSGGAGADSILTDGGTVNGDGGNDLIAGGPSSDVLNGGDGDDSVYGHDGDDTLTGGTGNDRLYAGSGANSVSDGSGDDLVDLTENAVGVGYASGGGNDVVLGTPFSDSITGSSGADRLEGRGGNDRLTGGPGGDAIYGNDGSDRLVWSEGDGSDLMEGGAGDSDLVDVTGSGSGDAIVVQATPGSRVGVQRTNLTPFALDIGSAEDLRVDGASGPDTVDLRSLAGTDILAVNIDAGLVGVADTVDVHGSAGGDALTASSPAAGTVDLGGLAYDVTVAGLDAADGDTVRPVGDGGTDSLSVDGSGGTDALGVDLINASSADVTGAVPAIVGGRAVEAMTVDGKGGGDALTVSTPSGADNVTLTPGAAPDAGSVVATGLLPVDYRGLGAGSIQLANTGGTRQDALTYRGTAAGDLLGIGPGGTLSLNGQVPVNPTGAASVTADMLAGDDTVNGAAPLPYNTTVLGGDSTQGDTLALTAAPGAVGVDLATSVAGLESLAGVPGRFERIDLGQPFTVLVDYAHTPDSLDNVLRAARAVSEKRVIVVFGCGGDRDRAKRPLMGAIAGRLADLVVVTSDNPRSEPPEAIVEEVVAGVRRSAEAGAWWATVDRRAAIAEALAAAGQGDAVVIAGKGHEQGQEFAGGRKVPFDDRVVAAEELARLLGEAGPPERGAGR